MAANDNAVVVELGRDAKKPWNEPQIKMRKSKITHGGIHADTVDTTSYYSYKDGS